MASIHAFLRGVPRWALIMTAAFLVMIIGALDYVAGKEISFSILFLLPVSIVAIYVDMQTGICFSIIAAATWFMVDMSSGGRYSHSAIPIWNAVVQLGFFMLAALILSRLEKAYAREKALARSDPLTRVANTTCFYDLAGREMDRVERYGRPFSLAYIDLDNFKGVNDRFGHEVGDEVLRLVARAIADNIRKTDTVARLGGDEFALLFPETKAEDALAAVEKLRELLLFNMRERQWPVTLSIGLVTYQEPPASVEEMVRKADSLMYEVKGTTKDGIKQEVR